MNIALLVELNELATKVAVGKSVDADHKRMEEIQSLLNYHPYGANFINRGISLNHIDEILKENVFLDLIELGEPDEI